MANNDLTLGTYHMSDSDGRGNYEVARSNFFMLQIHGLDTLYRADSEETDKTADNAIVDGGKVIQLSVKKFQPPHFSTQPIEIRRGNSVIKYADIPSFENQSLEVQDFVGLNTKQVLMAWQALVYDVVTDKQGRAYDWEDSDGIKHIGYKRDATLVEYTPDWEQIRSWDIKGCWISGLSESPFEVETSTGARDITVTLQYDRAICHEGRN